MNKLEIALFCVLSLGLSLGVAAWLFPHAAMSQQRLQTLQTPQPMEELPDIDLGPDFGLVPVTELVGYYIESPPAADGGAALRQQQFGGC